MSCVGFCGPRRRMESRLPRRFPHFTILDVVVDIRHFFRSTVSCPESLRPAKVRDSGIRRNARTRQDNHAFGGMYPALNGLDLACAHAQILQYFRFSHDVAGVVRFQLTGSGAGLYSESLPPAAAWCQGRRATQARPSSDLDLETGTGDPTQHALSVLRGESNGWKHPAVGQLPSPSPSANLVGQSGSDYESSQSRYSNSEFLDFRSPVSR